MYPKLFDAEYTACARIQREDGRVQLRIAFASRDSGCSSVRLTRYATS